MSFNNSLFVAKTLQKAIMHRSRLKNIYILKRNDRNWEKYKNQRNFCVDLLRKSRAEHLKNLNVKRYVLKQLNLIKTVTILLL